VKYTLKQKVPVEEGRFLAIYLAKLTITSCLLGWRVGGLLWHYKYKGYDIKVPPKQ
jgi:hypothetical protein